MKSQHPSTNSKFSRGLTAWQGGSALSGSEHTSGNHDVTYLCHFKDMNGTRYSSLGMQCQVMGRTTGPYPAACIVCESLHGRRQPPQLARIQPPRHPEGVA